MAVPTPGNNIIRGNNHYNTSSYVITNVENVIILPTLNDGEVVEMNDFDIDTHEVIDIEPTEPITLLKLPNER